MSSHADDALPTLDLGVRHHGVDLGTGVHLHWVEEGDGPPVVLLHGFPEFWYSWRYQIPWLAGRGLRVLAPDLRGYGGSGKPAEVDAYRVERVAGDVLALLDLLGLERAALVGHDWGGVVTWWLLENHPGRVDRAVVLNAPHPALYRRALLRSDQLLRSWYLAFFQLPGVPERLFRARDFGLVERIFRRDVARHDVLHEADFTRYVEALSRPGALPAMLHYYRAAVRAEAARAAGRFVGLVRGGSRGTEREAPSRQGGVSPPVLVIWGEADRYLSPRLLDGLEDRVADVQIERLPGVGHFVHQEAHERVNALLTPFLAGED